MWQAGWLQRSDQQQTKAHLLLPAAPLAVQQPGWLQPHPLPSSFRPAEAPPTLPPGARPQLRRWHGRRLGRSTAHAQATAGHTHTAQAAAAQTHTHKLFTTDLIIVQGTQGMNAKNCKRTQPTHEGALHPLRVWQTLQYTPQACGVGCITPTHRVSCQP